MAVLIANNPTTSRLGIYMVLINMTEQACIYLCVNLDIYRLITIILHGLFRAGPDYNHQYSNLLTIYTRITGLIIELRYKTLITVGF